MPTIYLIHGFVGAGKTTFSKKLEKETGAVRYSADEWMRARYGENPPAEKFSDFLSTIKCDILTDARKKLAKGCDVIFDYGFWSYAERKQYRMLATDIGVPFVLYHIYAEDKVMEDRVLQRTKEMPDGQLFIDKNAIEVFRARFEPLREDEDHISIKTG